MEKSLKIAKIEIKGFLGIENLELNPSDITLISAKNGQGKTSIMEAIKTALIGGGKNSELINKDAKKASIGIEFDNGMLVKKHITNTSNTLNIINKDGSTFPKPSTYLKNLFDFDIINPIELLQMKAKDRTELILNSIKLEYPKEKIADIEKVCDNKVTLTEENAILDLNRMYNYVFSERTISNRFVKEKQNTINSLSNTINNDIEEEEVLLLKRNKLNDTSTILIDDLTTKQNKIEAGTELKVSELKAKSREVLVDLQNSLNTQQTKLKNEYEKAMSDAESSFITTKSSLIEDFKKQQNILISKDNEKLTTITEELNKAKFDKGKLLTELDAKLEISASQTTIKATISNEQATLLLQQGISETFSNALELIKTTKTELLNNIPIQGIEITDEGIFVNGIVFDRLNSAKQIEIATQICLLNKPPFVLIDGAERLDKANRELLFNEFKKNGTQLIVTKVGDDKLIIEDVK